VCGHFRKSTAPSPCVVAMIGASLDVVRGQSWRRTELWDRARAVRRILRAGGVPVPQSSSEWDEASPIVPVILPGEDRALRFCQNMRESGIELRAIRYPTVPKGSERLRISLNLSVSRENTELMANEIVRQWQAP
jgi:8-amino-7-oxononanoate synthase